MKPPREHAGAVAWIALLLVLPCAAAATKDAAPTPQRLTGTARADAAALPRDPESRALLAIEAAGRRQAEEAGRIARGLPEGPERRARLAQIERIKRDTWVQVLLARAQFARTRGDLGTARECERAADQLLRPRSGAAIGTLPQGPVKPAPATGGAR